MMLLPLEDIGDQHRDAVGGKAWSLARIAGQGILVPPGLALTIQAYRAFLESTGLGERIMLELSRKDFADMRWEEMWDASQRIRNLFSRTRLPPGLEQELAPELEMAFPDAVVAVRSSAPGEDDSSTSFAGLHESYVNLRGTATILAHIKLVWASLWSDAALLYRQHTGLRPDTNAMAVLVQKMVQGSPSGVAFTHSPVRAGQCVLEAVHGLNQGLVDGTIQPDRWIFDRDSLKLIEHLAPERTTWIVPDRQGTRKDSLPKELADRPPIDQGQARMVMEQALRLETLFGSPQDMEWTLDGDVLIILQSRPITTLPEDDSERQRRWHLSLRRKLPELERLAEHIENRLIPEMVAEAAAMESVDLTSMTLDELAGEIRRRALQVTHWTDVYWAEFIPFAHGMRLFGQFYNDALNPEDPYEFLKLLAGSGLQSVQRNAGLSQLARRVSEDSGLKNALQTRSLDSLPGDFRKQIDGFIEKYGDLSCPETGGSGCDLHASPLPGLLLEMASAISAGIVPQPQQVQSPRSLEKRFLKHFPDQEKKKARRILELGRKSYRLRDDDNIHLGRIQAQLSAALQQAERVLKAGKGDTSSSGLATLRSLIAKHRTEKDPVAGQNGKPDASMVGMRQLRGQPAGPGLAQGPARVVEQHHDLRGFKQGEVLVCDAVDPNMTFVVPLASAIVERRGGMLIHGAIIAREYGLPCVTGIPEATRLIRSGDHLTVDGHLGIVTLRRRTSNQPET